MFFFLVVYVLHHNFFLSFSPIKDGGKREKKEGKKNLWMEAGKPCKEQEVFFFSFLFGMKKKNNKSKLREKK